MQKNSVLHEFSVVGFALPSELADQKAIADELCRIGNWFLAAIHYGQIYEAAVKAPSSLESELTLAKIAAHAASCFDVAGQSRSGSRYYEIAARHSTSDHHAAGELFNRAAILFAQANEHFSAGQAWLQSSQAFSNLPGDVVNCSGISPLPMSSFKSHLCGVLLEAAGASFERCSQSDFRLHSVGAYWNAGNAYASGIPNIQAFNAYGRALVSAAKYYRTSSLDELQLILPLTEAERSKRVDPFKVLEGALARCNDHHQSVPGKTRQSSLRTASELKSLLKQLALELSAVGSLDEARKMRIKYRRMQRSALVLQNRMMRASLYSIWEATFKYGEDWRRWFFSCAFVMTLFAGLFSSFSSLSSGTCPSSAPGFMDALYFSVVTFTTLGYGDLHPCGAVAQILSSCEVLLGLTMFGLLVASLTARLQRD